MNWKSMREYPKRGWVFVYFDDGLEYGYANKGGILLGNYSGNGYDEWFEVFGAKGWCEAPEPNGLIL